MSVEVLARAVVAHGGAWIGVAGGDLDVAEADACVEHGDDEGVPQHVGVHPRHADAGRRGEVSESAGYCVPVHPGTRGVAQDRTAVSAVDRMVDSSGDGWRQRYQDDLASLPWTLGTRWPCSCRGR